MFTLVGEIPCYRNDKKKKKEKKNKKKKKKKKKNSELRTQNFITQGLRF